MYIKPWLKVLENEKKIELKEYTKANEEEDFQEFGNNLEMY